MRQGNSFQLNFDGNSFTLQSGGAERGSFVDSGGAHSGKARVPTGVKVSDPLNKTAVVFKSTTQGAAGPAGKPITASTKT